MSPGDALAVVAAGIAAGTVNTIVGSGSLITFPTLLGLGYPAVLANVTNTVGLVPGSLSGAIGYRRELGGQRAAAIRLGVVGAAGGALGAGLLLALPGSVFRAVVPYLILLACALVAAQPWLARVVGDHPRKGLRAALGVTVFATAVYGGYFGAAQGVLLIALLGIFSTESLQRLNALKNVITAVVNGVAAALFITLSHVSWSAAGLLAIGAIIGGQLGALTGRRLSAQVLRWVIAVVGVGVAAALLAGGLG